MQNNNPSSRDWRREAAAARQQPSPLNATNALRAKFLLPALSEGVEKIAGLVKGRASASMDEITEIINTNSGVTQRLMSIAYPKQAARIGATVQMATSRLGVNRVIVVMVGDLLTKAVVETFETMGSMTLESDNSSAASMADHGFLTGSVRFSGENNGRVTLAFSPHLSLLLAAQLLGGELGDEHPPEAINDVIGELVNIVTGNLQSKLSDAGMPSEVGLPEVRYQSTLRSETVPGGSDDQFFFRFGTHTLVVNLSIDPSAPKGAPKAPMTKGTSWRANGF